MHVHPPNRSHARAETAINLLVGLVAMVIVTIAGFNLALRVSLM